MSKDLIMKFLDGDGKKVSIKLRDVKDNLTETEIDNLMDVILSKKIFNLSKSELERKEEAQIVNTNIEEFDLKY